MSRKKFNRRVNIKKSKEIGDLIHTDICGPIEPTTAGGNKYFLTYTDDKSRNTTTYLLREKSEAFTKFIEYRKYLSTQFKAKIKALKSDNGGEYISNNKKLEGKGRIDSIF